MKFQVPKKSGKEHTATEDSTSVKGADLSLEDLKRGMVVQITDDKYKQEIIKKTKGENVNFYMCIREHSGSEGMFMEANGYLVNIRDGTIANNASYEYQRDLAIASKDYKAKKVFF